MTFQNKYPIFNLAEAQFSVEALEPMGSKRKAWLTYKLNNQDTRILYKQGRPNTEEDMAEKATCELAELLGLPHANYHFAKLKNGDPCVISPSFLEKNDEMRFGNELIEGFDKENKFKNTQHTLEAILSALEQNKTQLQSSPHSEHAQKIITAPDLFIGYLCFDAWVGNTDRHAENWGIITNKINKINFLAPTFDHASSLGRNESDERRIERLKTKDKGFNVRAYIQKAKMPIYDADGHELNIRTLVQECKKHNIVATQYWINKIIDTMHDTKPVYRIFDQIPDVFISQPAKDFALAILNESVNILNELRDE